MQPAKVNWHKDLTMNNQDAGIHLSNLSSRTYSTRKINILRVLYTRHPDYMCMLCHFVDQATTLCSQVHAHLPHCRSSIPSRQTSAGGSAGPPQCVLQGTCGCPEPSGHRTLDMCAPASRQHSCSRERALCVVLPLQRRVVAHPPSPPVLIRKSRQHQGPLIHDAAPRFTECLLLSTHHQPTPPLTFASYAKWFKHSEEFESVPGAAHLCM